jgi:hypothetical protein
MSKSEKQWALLAPWLPPLMAEGSDPFVHIDQEALS